MLHMLYDWKRGERRGEGRRYVRGVEEYNKSCNKIKTKQYMYMGRGAEARAAAAKTDAAQAQPRRREEDRRNGHVRRRKGEGRAGGKKGQITLNASLSSCVLLLRVCGVVLVLVLGAWCLACAYGGVYSVLCSFFELRLVQLTRSYHL